MSNAITLTSGISKYYKKCFIVDEDTLRRIQGILQKAAQELTTPTVVTFFAEREDDRFYEVDNVADLISDPNIFGKRVASLMVELQYIDKEKRSQDREWLVRIIFIRERKYKDLFTERNEVRLQISGENRNWALLLADELEPQVLRTFKAKSTPRWLLLSFLLPVFLALSRLGKISRDWFILGLSGTFIIGLLLLALVYTKDHNLPPSFARFLGPESVFLWGEEIQEYQGREQLRTNMLWGIIVSFIISFITSGASLFF